MISHDIEYLYYTTHTCVFVCDCIDAHTHTCVVFLGGRTSSEQYLRALCSVHNTQHMSPKIEQIHNNNNLYRNDVWCAWLWLFQFIYFWWGKNIPPRNITRTHDIQISNYYIRQLPFFLRNLHVLWETTAFFQVQYRLVY